MPTIAPPTIPDLMFKHAEHAAQRIARYQGYCSPDGTHFTVYVDLEGDSVTATLSDGRIIHAVPRTSSGHFVFQDGVELDAKYTLIEEDVIGKAVTRRAVPHFHMTSMDYLVLELANQLVRTSL